MSRIFSGLLLSLFVGCAAAPTVPERVSYSVELAPRAPAPSAPSSSSTSVLAGPIAWPGPDFPHPTLGSLSTSASILAEPEPADSPFALAPLPSVPPPPIPLRNSRFTAKAGYLDMEESVLGEGFTLNATWMNFITDHFAMEFELAYLNSSGSDGKTWGIPVMVNGRLDIPIWVFELYGGIGFGLVYQSTTAGDQRDNGFVFGGNTFLGLGVFLTDDVAIGIEGKYYRTESVAGLNKGLGSYAGLLTISFGT